MKHGPADSPEWAKFSRALGLSIRQARSRAGLTQERTAELAGISLYSYQQYERGQVVRGGEATNPRLATILAISQALDTTLENLLPEVPRLLPR